MFRKSFFMAALVAVLAASYAAQAASTTILGGAHDFSTVAGGWAQGQVCLPCHTPHKAQAVTISTRLWNHALTTATYTLRDGTTGLAANELDATSYLCMGCHDGSVALDAFGGATSGTTYIGAGGMLGLDRRMDHPVGLDAAYSTSGTRMKPVTQTVSTSSGATSYKVVVGSYSLGLVKVTDATSSVSAVNSTGGAVTEAGVKVVVSCKTCHDQHTNTAKLLRTVNNNASVLCLGCHNK